LGEITYLRAARICDFALCFARMSQPRILIPIPIQDDERRRFTMGKNYIGSVIASGGVPVLVPTALDSATVRELYDAADGVLLTGGADVDPALFGETQHPSTEGIDADRDRVEIDVTRWALADDKPLFAICRGIQVVNVALGGSLIQDIPSQFETDLVHAGSSIKAARDQVLHSVRSAPGSKLEAIIGAGEVGVNSFHHQSVKALAPGLALTALSPDEIVEAVEHPGKRFFLGVQWHPEEMAAGRSDMMALFEALVRSSAQ
jgi:putative glutamine amidotransferase